VTETLKVGIREFRDKLASYLLESDVPVAITRHGDTVGYYIPARRKRTEADRTALKEAASHLQAVLAAEGISEDEILKDFKQWRGASVNDAAQGAGAAATIRKWRCEEKILFLFCYFLLHFNHAVKKVRSVRLEWMPPHFLISSNSIPKH
jgi:PHD/YefM family antitoxin component YafN of YafNO toxin-antitoxin module